jgi:hypothetical protein
MWMDRCLDYKRIDGGQAEYYDKRDECIENLVSGAVQRLMQAQFYDYGSAAKYSNQQAEH